MKRYSGNLKWGREIWHILRKEHSYGIFSHRNGRDSNSRWWNWLINNLSVLYINVYKTLWHYCVLLFFYFFKHQIILCTENQSQRLFCTGQDICNKHTGSKKVDTKWIFNSKQSMPPYQSCAIKGQLRLVNVLFVNDWRKNIFKNAVGTYMTR